MTDEREEFVHDPVAHAEVRAGMTVGDLADEYGRAGIGATDLHRAVDIYTAMLAGDVTNFLGLAGAMVPAGMRRVVADLIRDGHVDALVTTGATLTHDAIEAIGGHHHHGRAGADHPRPGPEQSIGSRSPDSTAGEGAACGDTTTGQDSAREAAGPAGPGPHSTRDHDERLREEGVDRIYNVYLPQEHFAEFETHLRERVFPELERRVSIRELAAELGRANAAYNREAGVEADPGVAAAAHEHDVPVYVPAVQDSVLGIQAWMYSRTSAFSLDALADMTHLTDLAFDAETAGALVVGGGVPKNFVLQAMLAIPDAYEYAVQLTTDTAHTGGLSGATLDEARSWGKLEPGARNATVVADATITLPLLVAAARERVEG